MKTITNTAMINHLLEIYHKLKEEGGYVKISLEETSPPFFSLPVGGFCLSAKMVGQG